MSIFIKLFIKYFTYLKNVYIINNEEKRVIMNTRKILSPVFIIFIISLLITNYQPILAQNDSDNDGLMDSTEAEIASKFAPNLQFAGGEKFFPVSLDYHISNSDLKLKSSGGDQVVSSSPTIDTISNFPDGDYYLDNKLGGLEEIYSDYSSKKSAFPPVVYVRVTPDRGSIVVQYWFFYAYNEGPLNEHEGDWEMIELILDQSGSNPKSSSYSQHLSGQSASWGDVEKRSDTHPIVYVALGSHANYFRSYQGNFGFESDTVGGDGELLVYDEYDLILLGEIGLGNHPSSQDWLDFGGRWGDWALYVDAIRGTAGPYGPAKGDNSEKWLSPMGWGLDLEELDGTFLIMNLIIANFYLIFGVVVILLSLIRIRGIYRQSKRGELRISTLLRSNAVIGVGLGTLGILLTIGAIITPWYAVQGDIQSQEIQTDGLVDIISIDGFNGIRVNTLQDGQGLTSMFNLAIPFAIIMIISVIFGLIDIIGVKSSKSLGSKFIRSGISNLIPVIVIIIFIFQFMAIIDSIDTVGGFEIGPEVRDFAQQISNSPIQGDYFTTIQSYGSVALSWGLGLGAYLFIGAALVKFIAGVLTRRATLPKQQE